MENWYPKIERDTNLLPDFIDYYEQQLLDAKKEMSLKGVIEKNASELPSIIEIRFNQLQDIEAVLEHFNIELRRIKFKHFKAYLETYNGPRALNDRQLAKFADGEPEVLSMEEVVNKIALIRNQYLGLMKGLENKSFSLSNLVRLRCAGLDDAEI